jgi:hypothetical protein
MSCSRYLGSPVLKEPLLVSPRTANRVYNGYVRSGGGRTLRQIERLGGFSIREMIEWYYGISRKDFSDEQWAEKERNWRADKCFPNKLETSP